MGIQCQINSVDKILAPRWPSVANLSKFPECSDWSVSHINQALILIHQVQFVFYPSYEFVRGVGRQLFLIFITLKYLYGKDQGHSYNSRQIQQTQAVSLRVATRPHPHSTGSYQRSKIIHLPGYYKNIPCNNRTSKPLQAIAFHNYSICEGAAG